MYQAMFEKFGCKKKVAAGIIGSGHYGKAVVTQSMVNPLLDIPIIADSDLDAAKSAFLQCGISEADILYCDSAKKAASAIEAKKYVVTDDPMILMELPLDIIAESTGLPEPGAVYAEAAFKSGKHVAMINKETDCVIGPYLKTLADKAGLVYTPVEGDQHGLLMNYAAWAKGLGLEILNAGKVRDGEYIYSRAEKRIDMVRDLEHEGEQRLADGDLKYFEEIPDGRVEEYIAARKKALPNLPCIRGFDVSEALVAANALNLAPDVPELHFPTVRTREMPRVLCTKEDGGIFSRNGMLDTITQLRTPEEANLGGGVYLIVSCANGYSRHILNSKGLMFNKSGNASLLYRPYHLCGVETSTSLLCAALLGLPTGYADYKQRYDMVKRTRCALKKGTVVGDDFSFDYDGLILPVAKISPKNPIPAHMAFGNRLKVDVPANTILTFDMVEEPADSALWRLRREQENSPVFGF